VRPGQFQTSVTFRRHFVRTASCTRVCVELDPRWSAVEERVVDGRAHGDDVCTEEREQKIRPLVLQLTVVVVRDDYDVQRQPAADEYRNHRNQHAVRASLALYFCLITRAPTTTRQSSSELEMTGKGQHMSLARRGAIKRDCKTQALVNQSLPNLCKIFVGPILLVSS